MSMFQVKDRYVVTDLMQCNKTSPKDGKILGIASCQLGSVHQTLHTTRFSRRFLHTTARISHQARPNLFTSPPFYYLKGLDDYGTDKNGHGH